MTDTQPGGIGPNETCTQIIGRIYQLQLAPEPGIRELLSTTA